LGSAIQIAGFDHCWGSELLSVRAAGRCHADLPFPLITNEIFIDFSLALLIKGTLSWLDSEDHSRVGSS
jgi:hypothetical protein